MTTLLNDTGLRNNILESSDATRGAICRVSPVLFGAKMRRWCPVRFCMWRTVAAKLPGRPGMPPRMILGRIERERERAKVWRKEMP